MFEMTETETRGFSGRPLIALLFAVAMGIATYEVGSRMHMSEFTAFVISLTITVAVGYAWERLESSRV